MATRENDSMVWQHTWNFFSSQKTENALSINVMITLLPTTSWAYTFFSAIEENESYFCGKNCNKTELLLTGWQPIYLIFINFIGNYQFYSYLKQKIVGPEVSMGPKMTSDPGYWAAAWNPSKSIKASMKKKILVEL